MNKAVIVDCYRLPAMDESAAQCHGSTTFTKLDLHHGYLQMLLALYMEPHDFSHSYGPLLDLKDAF